MTGERRKGMETLRKNLENELARLERDAALSAELADLVFDFPRKKFSDIHVIRGFFAYAMHGYICEQAEREGRSLRLRHLRRLFDTRLPLVFELVISVQYLANQVLDGKGGVRDANGYDLNRVCDNLQAGAMLKDVLYRYVARVVFPRNRANRDQVEAFLGDAFLIVDEGQFLEKRHSSFENFRRGFERLPPLSRLAQELLDPDLIDTLWELLRREGLDARCESFTRYYLRRIFCSNAAPFVLMTRLLFELTGYDGPECPHLLRFAAEFGMLAQLINDLTDVVPAEHGQRTVAKIPQDAFSDLRNDNITLPFIFLFDQHRHFVAPALRLFLDSDDKQRYLLDILKPVCRDTLIPFLWEWAGDFKEKALNSDFKQYKLLGDLISLAYNSRFFQHFGKMEKRKRHKKTMSR